LDQNETSSIFVSKEREGWDNGNKSEIGN